jgi:diguanylate cyclase (GGDEF)-like protein
MKYTRQGYIFESRPLGVAGWKLYAVVNEEKFFSRINRQWLILLSVVCLVSLAVFALTVMALRPVIRTLLLEKKLVEQTHRDSLTGLYNHAYMQQLLDIELERSRRYGHMISILMFDLDHFKRVNDVNGHQAGDIVLKRVAEVVSQTIRIEDIAARYGGEEFLVIFPETGGKSAFHLADRLLNNVSQTKILIPDGTDISVTISIGVVTCDACQPHYNKHQIINKVDKALYASKEAGRNRITVVSLQE